MQSPFSDFTAPDTERYTSSVTAFELESPLVDPGELEYENVEMEQYSYEGFTGEDIEVTNIDVQKAILFNKKYQTELWGSQVSSITKYFASIGITKDTLPLSADNFALAVAKWQATVFTNPKSIDGALGSASWNLLKSRISSVPVPAPSPTTTRSRWHSIITNTVSSPAIPLVHGKETFRQMVAAIKTATSSGHYIYILGWMLDVDFEMIPGDKTSTLIQLLQDASKRNVEIRVLIWDSPLYIKDISNAATKINSLTNAVLIKDNATFGSPGIKSAISKIRFLLSQAPLFLRFINSWNDFVAKANTIQNEGSHHEKVLVVKGKEGLIGFCGGIDINPNRVKGVDSIGRSTVLHDIHCEVRGHAAWVLLHRFIWRWQVYKTRASLPTPKLLSAPLLGDKEPLPVAAVPGANVAQVKILQTYNHPGNNIKDRSIREAVKLAIFNAKKSVHIEDQYMISLEIASWLNNKLASEPNFSSVTILTQDDDIAGEDILFPKQMRKKFVDQLVNGLSAVNRKKIFIQMLHRSAPLTAHHKIHSKIYIIDDELAIIGSANLSSRSMTHDSETAAIIFNDPGASINFALQLKAKMKADPDTNIISYSPNSNVKDIDVKVIDELNNLSTTKRIALAATFGPTFTLLIPQVIKTLLTQLKPALIDIIDPDADNTQPQQELEGWPESLQADSTYNEREEHETAMEELFIPVTNESLENYQPGDNQESEDETNVYPAQFENGAEELDFSNEQATNGNYGETSNPYFPAENETAEVIENQVAMAKTPVVNTKPCEGLTCWAKDALNKCLNINLTLNNSLDEATKKVIGDFQVKNNLAQTQKIDPTTERVLLEADAIRRHKGTVLDQVATKTITEAKTKIEDFTKKAVNNKPQYILNSYRDPRKVYAFVLHHMAFKRTGPISKKYSDPAGYLSTGAHFCIMLDGRIIQLHAMARMIWHGHCISPGSVAVEFEGNFPNIKGTWWYPTDKKTGKKIKVNEDKPTQAQFDSGRFLACYLKVVLGTTTILAHRQSDDSRENDPGPDIWFNVGQWAVDKLGLSDGGPTFKCGTGKPILPEWRTWGNRVSPNISKENYEQANDMEWEENFAELETPLNEFTDNQESGEAFQDEEWQDNFLEDTASGIENEDTENENVAENLPGGNFKHKQTTGRPVILARGVSKAKHTFYKMYDKLNKKFIGETYDEQGNRITQSELQLNENEVTDNLNNKIHPTLQLQILKAADTTPIDIAVWLNIDVKEPSKTNYQSNQLATMPAEIAEHRKKLAVTIADTAKKVTIERSGIQVQRVSDLLPMFFAKTTKRTIDLIKNDPLVLGVFYNDRSYFESLSTSLSRSGAAEAQTAGMTNLGKDIKAAVWENAPDVLTNLTIDGYFDPTTPNVSDHARLVSAIIKNKEPEKPKGYAPNCKLYSANLSGTDVFAPLEWAVKQGCTVINRSFHQNTDQVNAGMQLSDFVTDALALRYPYPMIVQASGNTGQPDDTALGITPATNEYVNHKGYNSIAVGSHDEQTERKISTFSTFRNPSSPHNDRELPEICALGENITAVGLVDWAGTSFASPAVAGSVAILQSISPLIKFYPEVVRALLLAGAKRNVDGGLWYQDLKQTPKVDQKDGTGALNIYECITMAKQPYQLKKVALEKGWDYGRFDASGFGPDKISLREWKIIVPKDKKHVKIALAWNSNANYIEIWSFKFLKDTTLDMDLDILVYDEKNTFVASSSSFDNSFEIADYIAQAGQTLTVKIRGYSVKPTAWTYFGIAWTTF